LRVLYDSKRPKRCFLNIQGVPLNGVYGCKFVVKDGETYEIEKLGSPSA
jgi:hypothetical protein